MFWNEAMETIPAEELEALQFRRLKWTLRQVQEVGFYRNRLQDAGVRPDDIRSLEDIQKLPFTYKKDLQAGYPFGFLAVPKREVVRIHTTSGTTGKPTVVCYTRQDLENWAELIARNMVMIGLTSDDVFQNAVN